MSKILRAAVDGRTFNEKPPWSEQRRRDDEKNPPGAFWAAAIMVLLATIAISMV